MQRKLVTGQEFRRNKRRLMAREEKNYDKIILLPRTGLKGKDRQWFEVAEHSALIYFWAVCEPLGEMVKFAEDVDSYYDRYKVGLICMNGFAKLKMLLKKSGLYAGEEEEEDFYVFKLNRRFAPKQIAIMREKEFERRRENNTIIPVTFSDPDLYVRIKNVGERLHRVCNARFNKLDRDTTGARMVELIDKVMLNYMAVCQPEMSNPRARLKYWEKICLDVRRLSFEIQTAVTMKVMGSNDAMHVCGELRGVYKKVRAYRDGLVKGLRKRDNGAS